MGEERSSPHRIPGGGRHPGSRERVALRGVTLERGPRSIHEDGGSIQPSGRRIGDAQGCPRSSREEGSLHPRRPAAAGGVWEGPSLRATRPAQSSAVVQRPSPQAVVGSRRRPQAASRSDGGFRGLVFAACLQRRKADFEGTVAARSTRDPSSTGEGRQANQPGERERGFEVTAKAGRSTDQRESGARECVRASEVQLQKSLGGSLTQRSARRRFA